MFRSSRHGPRQPVPRWARWPTQRFYRVRANTLMGQSGAVRPTTRTPVNTDFDPLGFGCRLGDVWSTSPSVASSRPLNRRIVDSERCERSSSAVSRPVCVPVPLGDSAVVTGPFTVSKRCPGLRYFLARIRDDTFSITRLNPLFVCSGSIAVHYQRTLLARGGRSRWTWPRWSRVRSRPPRGACRTCGGCSRSR